MKRWLIDFGIFSIRLHHWLYSDDQRNYHDHPWAFITIILKGGYTDISPKDQNDISKEESKKERMTFGTVKYRPANYKHTVKVDKKGCWTLLLTGREKRDWGFWVKRKDGSNIYRLMKRNRYFLRVGHHPCETE